jgi:hypothetical protein
MTSEFFLARKPVSAPGPYYSLSTNLDSYRLRNTHLPEIKALVEHLDSYRPSLKSDIHNLTFLLSLIIEDRCLPEQRLRLETLCESQIVSGEHAAQSLKDLFEFTDECLGFLAETTQPDQSITEGSPCSLVSLGSLAETTPDQSITESSPRSLVSLGEQVDDSTAFPRPSSLDNLFLSSPLNSPDIDSFRPNYFNSN